MTPTREGSFRLFRFAGIDVFLHWSWFLVAWISIQNRSHEYSSMAWNIAEYLALFVTVLMHEFGHSLACRQVGGRADQIVLWPLGGVAYVAPPPRPGANLWSIAAGPLVNVVLLPGFFVLASVAASQGWERSAPDAFGFLWAMVYLNAGLLMFNLLPIYPLDGGQILRSLLWFVVGPAKSLLAATFIGFAGVAGLVALAIYNRSIWMGVMSGFILLNCRQGWLQARAMMRMAKIPRRDGYACPACGTAPIIGPVWTCATCGGTSDAFATHGTCPTCVSVATTTPCPDCGESSPLLAWAKRRG